MCGIIGYIGKNKKAIPVLITGLKNLEYRGYDSAGVAYLNNGIEIIKEKGKIKELEKKLDMGIESNLGIGHTRWATHGPANQLNSHPHRVGSITIVHNGIIENYNELKKELSNMYQFYTETDTEVAAAVIDYNYHIHKDMLIALHHSMKMLKGSYAIGIICENDNNLYVIKNKSPLIIGLGKDENYVASDIHAILKYTNQYNILDDLEIARITPDAINVYDKDLNPKEKNISTIDNEYEMVDKNGFEHFMKKEIHEQPRVVKDTINEYINIIENKVIWNLPNIEKYSKIDIVACGSAMHAGMIGKYLIENYADIPVNVEVASEYRYKKIFSDKNTLVILVSQSGETADTLAALEIAKSRGCTTLAIVNVEKSSIARAADMTMYTKAGPEIAVATTKAYLAQVSIFCLMALYLSYKKGKKTIDEVVEIINEIEKLPNLICNVIQDNKIYFDVAKEIYENNDVYFMGRKIDYAISLEGSLKLKEISYIHSEAYQAGELKHGTISLIDNNTPVFGIVTDSDITDKTISNLKEVSARGAKIIAVVKDDLVSKLDFANKKVVVPKVNDLLQPIVSIVPLQLISYEVAKLRGCNIDKPKNLAKSVTVE